MRASRRAAGPLDAIVFEGEAGAPAVVLLHGYGADAADLAPLANETPSRRRHPWIFLEAPLTLAASPFRTGRSWFPLDERKLQEAQLSGRPADFSAERPAGLAEAAAAVSEALWTAGCKLGDCVIGGFSQGAMVAVQLALKADTAPRGLAILSGNLVNEADWRKLAPARRGLTFFQSHGTLDPLLDFGGALRLERLLRDGGLDGRLASFEGGHGIPPEIVDAFGAFLDGLP